MEISKDVLEKLKSEHGSLTELSVDNDAVVVRLPSRGEWKKFRATIADDRKRGDAAEQLLRSCIVFPDETAIEKMLDVRPGLAETFAGELVELAGAKKGVEKKAL